MKRILVVYYTQTGQLRTILDRTLEPVIADPGIEITWLELRPDPPFPFPWPLGKFLDVFPESVQLISPPCRWDPIDDPASIDLILFAYQVWYLSPSLPATAFLLSADAEVLRGKPVITLVNARDKWLTAQQTVERLIRQRGARHLDHVAFIHAGNMVQHTVTTLRWLWTGRKEAFGWFPAAGVSPQDLDAASRFGRAIQQRLNQGDEVTDTPWFRGLNPATADAGTVFQEEAARKIFARWSTWILRASRRGRGPRTAALALFTASLVVLLLLAGPFVLAYRVLVLPFRKKAMEARIRAYLGPSGMDDPEPPRSP